VEFRTGPCISTSAAVRTFIILGSPPPPAPPLLPHRALRSAHRSGTMPSEAALILWGASRLVRKHQAPSGGQRPQRAHWEYCKECCETLHTTIAGLFLQARFLELRGLDRSGGGSSSSSSSSGPGGGFRRYFGIGT
jgi:hypothetical protein